MNLPSAYLGAAALEEALGDPREPSSIVSFSRTIELDEREEFPQAASTRWSPAATCARWSRAENGGLFDSFESASALQRALSRRDLTCAVALGQSFLGSISVWLGGTAEQKSRAASHLLAGRSMGLALTEEEHGSDVLATGTRAEKIESGYRISGRKWLINNGTRGAAFSLFARTEGEGGLHGQSLFLLERAALGEGAFRPLAKIRTHGIRGADISGFVLDRAEVADGARLGNEGSGAELLFKSLQLTRVGCAAFSLGAADTALRLALDFATSRELYGGKLIELPHARAELLGVFLDLLLCDCAALAGSRAVQAAPEQLSLWSSAIKFFVPVTCEQAMRSAARVLGARHYLREQFAGGVFQKLLRDAAVVSLFDGSTAVNLDGIGTQLTRLKSSRAASEAERARTLEAVFAIGKPLPPLDGARLQLMNAGRCDVTQGLPEARTSWPGCAAKAALDAEVSGALIPLLLTLEEELARLAAEVAALQEQDRLQVKRSPELFACAERYCTLFAAACAVHVYASNRGRIDAFFDDGAWLVLLLDRAIGTGGVARARESIRSHRARPCGCSSCTRPSGPSRWCRCSSAASPDEVQVLRLADCAQHDPEPEAGGQLFDRFDACAEQLRALIPDRELARDARAAAPIARFVARLERERVVAAGSGAKLEHVLRGSAGRNSIEHRERDRLQQTLEENLVAHRRAPRVDLDHQRGARLDLTPEVACDRRRREAHIDPRKSRAADDYGGRGRFRAGDHDRGYCSRRAKRLFRSRCDWASSKKRCAP